MRDHNAGDKGDTASPLWAAKFSSRELEYWLTIDSESLDEICILTVFAVLASSKSSLNGVRQGLFPHNIHDFQGLLHPLKTLQRSLCSKPIPIILLGFAKCCILAPRAWVEQTICPDRGFGVQILCETTPANFITHSRGQDSEL